jgi:uncharacterized UBP type Zn finger protein
MVSEQRLVAEAAAASPNGSAPRCAHLDGLEPTTPRSQGCQECQVRQQDWTSLVMCLTCGWVACGDGSPGRHARAHYEETDHPLAVGMQEGSAWRWCYVHQRRV